MAEGRDMAEAGEELAAALRERLAHGRLRLDEYLDVVDGVALAHGLDRDALHGWFASNDGRDMAVVPVGPAPGGP